VQHPAGGTGVDQFAAGVDQYDIRRGITDQGARVARGDAYHVRKQTQTGQYAVGLAGTYAGQ
jgi:hypothetical protein